MRCRLALFGAGLMSVKPCSFHPSNFGPFEGVVTRQHKVAPDSVDAYKSGEQGRRELDRCATEALDNDLIDRPAVVVQVLLLREVESKFELFHVGAPKTGIAGCAHWPAIVYLGMRQVSAGT